ncbi:mandelate racemase/muconate lactonizing enzyme family protein [Candidatus Njordibacter sp. Uisw_002]|mgnify:FL=1|uniref:mandelate racemase/muconate lactonizing enzyme family protein n=1 Tax=Candidatus Njordibacter sp. Uisw_002 TaxID=3230971 RepID=UPI003D475BC9
MKISEIHIYQKDQRIVDGPYIMSTMTLTSIDATIIKVVADNGLVGWGEVSPLGPAYQPQHALGARAALCHLAPDLIGSSCLHPLLLQRRMNDLLNGHNYAKAAIDFAIMDLMGKYYKVRVCDLLGGPVRERLPAYFAISKGSPDDTARKAKDKLAQGYKRLQIKSGGRDVAEDIEAIRKVWEAVGNKANLVVDANRGMTGSQAMQLSLACKDIPFLFEQPCNTMEEVSNIRPQIAHPIALDENIEGINDVLRAISMNACDGFGLKLTRVGGLNAMATIRDVCEARGLPHTCEDSWGGDIVSAAILHMGATVKPAMLEGVWTAGNYIEESYDPANTVACTDGFFDLPTGFGLGITPQEDRIGHLVHSF